MGLDKVKAKPVVAAAKPVEFVVCIDGAKEVLVTGDFTGWSEEGIRLTPSGKGVWKATLKFLPGEYQYRVRVDGQWRDHSDAKKRVPNPFGTENCILTVT